MPTRLFEDTRRHIEMAMMGLTGGNDFQPLMVVRNHEDEMVVVPLMMPSETDAKNALAHTMTAICALHRAQEVAFGSTAWLVTRRGDEPLPDRASTAPDRQEVAMIAMLDVDGNGALHTAAVIRENNKVGCGLWEEISSGFKPGRTVHAGRFHDAMRIGIAMGQAVRNEQPDLAAYIDGQIAVDGGQRLVGIMVKQLAGMSSGGNAQTPNDGGVQK